MQNILSGNWQGHLHTIKADGKGRWVSGNSLQLGRDCVLMDLVDFILRMRNYSSHFHQRLECVRLLYIYLIRVESLEFSIFNWEFFGFCMKYWFFDPTRMHLNIKNVYFFCSSTLKDHVDISN